MRGDSLLRTEKPHLSLCVNNDMDTNKQYPSLSNTIWDDGNLIHK